MKVRNYGPGALYGGIHLFKEDVDPSTGRLLGRSMTSFSGDPLEPLHYSSTLSDRNVREGIIKSLTPCYSAKFYKPNLETASCDCEPAGSSDSVNTAEGVVCKKSKSECAGSTAVDRTIFAGAAPGVLQDTHNKAEARESLSGCLHAPGKLEELPALSNSILTAFEKTCKDAADCQFTRINDDQTSTNPNEFESWCGNDYVGFASTNPTGRKLRPTSTPVGVGVKEKTVLPASDRQIYLPVSTVSLP